MTPDELRARCNQALEHLEKVAAVRYYSIDPTVELGENAYLLVESLCREMIVVGLERAAEDAKKRQIHAESNAEGQNEEDFRMWLEVSRGHRYHEQWCRQEAQRVKEGQP